MPDDFQRRFGRRVRELRKTKGLTQEQLAEAIGRSVDTISNIERGSSLTRISTAAELARTLAVSLPAMFETVDDLLDHEDDRAKLPQLKQLLEEAKQLDKVSIDAAIQILRVLATVRRA